MLRYIAQGILFISVCFSFGCGNRLTDDEVRMSLVNAGFPAHAIPTMIKIANLESGNDVFALRKNPAGKRLPETEDIGLYQINTHFWGKPESKGGCGTDTSKWKNVDDNVACALKVYKQQGFSAWTAYKRHLRAQ